jgi:hypothetical protein
MTDETLRIDPEKLLTLADRVQRIVNALNESHPPAIDLADLPGSDSARAVGPERLSELFDPVLQTLTGWALGVRSAADGFAQTEWENTLRLTGR